MKGLNLSRWIAAASLGAILAAGASAQSVPLRPRDDANRPNRPAPVVLTKAAQDAVAKAAADFKKLPAEQRLAAARDLQRQIFESLTPEERAKLGPQMGPGGRGGRGGPGGQWGGRRGRNRPGGPGGPGGPPPQGPPDGQGGPPPPGGPDGGPPPPPPGQ
jgi:hypothetical protein